MSEFLEYDPDYGIRTDTDFNDETGEMTLIRTSDVEPLLDYTKAMANDGEISKKGIKENWWLYAKIPPIVILQLRAKGIDIFDPNNEKRLFAEINTHYKHLKCVSGNHGGKV